MIGGIGGKKPVNKGVSRTEARQAEFTRGRVRDLKQIHA
jgi:hypothetical protein